MFENPRRGGQARNFTTNVPKILDLKSSSEQIFSENCRWVPLATVRMEASTKNVEAIKRFKQLVEQHYNEPVNGQYEDCTKEVERESSSDEEDQNITTE